MRAEFQTISPPWAGTILDAEYPEAIAPLAVYASRHFTGNEVTGVTAIVVDPDSLTAFDMKIRESDREMGRVTFDSVETRRVSVARTSIVSVTASALIGVSQEKGIEWQSEDSLTIELKTSMEPFGTSIKLPLSENDYPNAQDAQGRAIRAIAAALKPALATA